MWQLYRQRHKMMRPFRWIKIASLVLATIGIAAALFIRMNFLGEQEIRADAPGPSTDIATIEKGAYLARVGNCASCHTARGGQPYAGGDALATPFGKVYSSNLTPDKVHGIGTWNADHFWRAMHHGRSKDGRLLTPAFPYTSYTLVNRSDSDAIFAFLGSVAAEPQASRPHELRAPFDSQVAIGVWRAINFSPASFVEQPKQDETWNRGAYLVRGLGHCEQCHGTRNALGALQNGLELNGGLMAGHGWYAPSLIDAKQGAVKTWSTTAITQLLRDGQTAIAGNKSDESASVIGPMAQVVSNSLQYLTEADAIAMASYLKALPDSYRSEDIDTSGGLRKNFSVNATSRLAGQALYKQHCASCHGEQGQGGKTESGKTAYPALAGNRAVMLAAPDNIIQVILQGGYSPVTPAHPLPFGMLPFAPTLNNDEVASLISFMRNAWGNQAGPVLSIQVSKVRESKQ